MRSTRDEDGTLVLITYYTRKITGASTLSPLSTGFEKRSKSVSIDTILINFNVRQLLHLLLQFFFFLSTSSVSSRPSSDVFSVSDFLCVIPPVLHFPFRRLLCPVCSVFLAFSFVQKTDTFLQLFDFGDQKTLSVHHVDGNYSTEERRSYALYNTLIRSNAADKLLLLLGFSSRRDRLRAVIAIV